MPICAPYMHMTRQRASGNANAEQLPLGFLLVRSCTRPKINRLIRAGERGADLSRAWTTGSQMSKSCGLKRQWVKKFLFSFGRETCNFAHGGSIEMSVKDNAVTFFCPLLPGHPNWQRVGANSAGQAVRLQSVEYGKVRRRSLPMHMNVSLVGCLHFPTRPCNINSEVPCESLMMWHSGEPHSHKLGKVMQSSNYV